jgi:methylenetetrahydrofolate dehydrogenase (NADP+) / methenyltetrahydrofolate cyclohydrolase
MPKIIDGKKISAAIREELKREVVKLKEKNITPGLAVVIVGDDPASRVYVNMKKKACAALDIYSVEHTLDKDICQQTLIDLIVSLNADPKINGILVQLPLPKQIDTSLVLEAISPDKDIDGFHPYNIGRLVAGAPVFAPCTPYGIIKLLEYSNVDLTGKEAVVVGRSNIVGKPVAMLLMQKNATVTVCHSKTKDLPAVCRRADVLIAAIGIPKMITADYVKEGAVVIDVGVNRLDDGSLCGDVDYEAMKDKASMITPVPGGVGPMTITMLMYNTIMSAKMANGITAC